MRGIAAILTPKVINAIIVRRATADQRARDAATARIRQAEEAEAEYRRLLRVLSY